MRSPRPLMTGSSSPLVGNRAGGPLLRSGGGSQTRLRRGNIHNEAPAHIYTRAATDLGRTGLDYTDLAVHDRVNARLVFDQ